MNITPNSYTITEFPCWPLSAEGTTLHFNDWIALLRYLNASNRSAASYDDLPLFTPAIHTCPTRYDPRSVSHITGWGGLVVLKLDVIRPQMIPGLSQFANYPTDIPVDRQVQHQIHAALKSFLMKRLGGHNFLAWCAAGSTPCHILFNLMLPLDKHLLQGELTHFDNVMYAAKNWIERQLGIPVMQSAHFGPPPTELFRAPGAVMDKLYFDITNYDKQNLLLDELIGEYSTDTQQDFQGLGYLTWESYQDCKYFPTQQLASNYDNIIDTGWYLTMYKLMCNIAMRCMKDEHSITPEQLTTLVLEFDRDHGGYHQNESLEREAQNAINLAQTMK